MKNIFSKIHRFEDMDFIQGEQFKFTLSSNKSEDVITKEKEPVSSKFENNKLYISEIASCGIAEANIITLNPEYIASYEVE